MKKMDFSTPEPKPEIIKGVDKSAIDQNKQEIFKFFNITNKTKVASSVVGLGLILFFVAVYTVSFNNQTLNTLYPKDQSKANQITTHTPISGAGFLLSGPQLLKVGDTLVLDVKVQLASESAGVMAAQIRFDNSKLEVGGIDDSNSVSRNWIDSNSSNESGLVSLVASFPTGISLPVADQFAKVTFKAKAAGETTISIDQKNSHMYRFRDKGEIKMEYDSLPVIIAQ